MASAELISLKDITKNFGAVQALKGVSLSLKPGELLALVGENGAGKSTLMKILSGVYPSGDFKGEIQVEGKPAHFRSPKDSENAGISLIHQELSTFPQLTVAENMVVGHWPAQKGWVDSKSMFENAKKWLQKLGSDFLPQQSMSSLSTGQQQVVEIAKALSRNSKVVILDEPTSSLTTRETQRLFSIIQELKKQGCGLIYISHRMEEIFSLSDRICVLRDGKSVFTADTKAVTEAQVIQHMVGRSLDQMFPERRAPTSQEVILELDGFAAREKATGVHRGPLSLKLRKGEILGFGGLLGAGRSEILQALAGDQRYETFGKIIYKGQAQSWGSLRQSYHRGFGMVPEDRKQQSLLPSRSLTENAGILRLSQNFLFSWVQNTKEKERAEKDLKALNTKFHSESQKITELSGGNQQKVVFTRVLQNAPDVLILDEPTRGVDVGAKFEIYQMMQAWTDQGKSILLVSSDLPELMAMSDRIFVMSEGQFQKELVKNEFHEEVIMKWALNKEKT